MTAKELEQYNSGPISCTLDNTSAERKKKGYSRSPSLAKQASDGANCGETNKTLKSENLRPAHENAEGGVNDVEELILIAKMADSGGVAHHQQFVAALREAVKKWVKTMKKHKGGSEDQKQKLMDVFKLVQNRVQKQKKSGIVHFDLFVP